MNCAFILAAIIILICRFAADSPAVTIQNPDTGFVFGGNRFQLANTDQRYEFTDNFHQDRWQHNVKAGVDINVSRNNDFFIYGPKGEYRFGNLTDVATGNFELYLQSFGQSTIPQTSPTYSLFRTGPIRATSTPDPKLRLALRSAGSAAAKQCNPAFALTCTFRIARTMLPHGWDLPTRWMPRAQRSFGGPLGLFYVQEDLLDVSQALASNGVTRPFLVVVGPALEIAILWSLIRIASPRFRAAREELRRSLFSRPISAVPMWSRLMRPSNISSATDSA